jgi:hypothetical protein
VHYADEFPKVKVFHTARTADELILLAPLLDHLDIFDISFHYTGQVPLATGTLILPSPVPLQNEDIGGVDARNSGIVQNVLAPHQAPRKGDVASPLTHAGGVSKVLSKVSHGKHMSASTLTTGRLHAVKDTPKSKGSKPKQLDEQEIGGFKKVRPAFIPDPEPRLINFRGRWESLVVWVGSWFAAFWCLVRFFGKHLLICVCVCVRICGCCSRWQEHKRRQKV